MELTAGLGSVDDYIRYIEAGADECFCGYIPYAWDRKYGTVLSLNRREVRCCSVQLGAFSELEILAAMVRAYQKPVQLTFNYGIYPVEGIGVFRVPKNGNARNKKPPALRVETKRCTKKSPFRYNRVVQALL